jgi:phosphoenolpyruvate synthase/pyruvate phosphate dikinase
MRMQQRQENLQENAQKVQINAQDRDQEKELLQKLIKKGVIHLEPTVNKSGVHYVEAEETLKNTDSTQVKGILRNLEKKGALKSKFADRVLKCPDCSSPEVYSKYTCPKCSSNNVEYTQLLEHMKCGCIGPKSNFTKGSSLVCPNCQAELKEEAMHYRVIGNCYQCEKCGYRFDKPEITHICQKCGRTFTYQEANYAKIFSYRITDKTVQDFRKDVSILGDIKEVLADKGFKVQLRPKITGSSGVQHSFDILAEKDEAQLAIDISVTGNKNDMISLLGKKVDTNPTKALIIDLSNLNELAPLEKVYDITVLKTKKEHDLPHQFGSFLATLEPKEKERNPNGSRSGKAEKKYEASGEPVSFTLTGIAASRGKTTGKAKVFKELDPATMNEKMEDGCVLVIPHSSPSVVSVMMRARAIVTDFGGLACHAAVFARQKGIPCVVDTRKATLSIMEDMLLEVDGGKGTVRCTYLEK